MENVEYGRVDFGQRGALKMQCVENEVWKMRSALGRGSYRGILVTRD